jgi:uncharacterized membrane protein
MSNFSVRPALSIKGRTFNGIRGWSGKPFHPPLTTIPIAAYVIGASFDVIAFIGQERSWSRDFFVAGTFLFITGAVMSAPAALTGFGDWFRSTEKGTQVRRTANSHAVAMMSVSALAVVNIALRLNNEFADSHPSVVNLTLSAVIAMLVALGATIGGSLVYEHGFNVENAQDTPAWNQSVFDVMPGPQETIEYEYPVADDDEMSPADRLAVSEVPVTSNTPDPLDPSSTSSSQL